MSVLVVWGKLIKSPRSSILNTRMDHTTLSFTAIHNIYPCLCVPGLTPTMTLIVKTNVFL